MLTHKTSRFIFVYIFSSRSLSSSFSLSLSLTSYLSICVGSNTCEAGYEAYDGDGGPAGRQCLRPCTNGGERTLHGTCNEPIWQQIMKIVGIVIGAASLVVVAFKAHLFFKLRHQGRLLPGYRGPSGFFTVFAYGTKGNHVKPSKSQTPVAVGGAGDLSASLIAGERGVQVSSPASLSQLATTSTTRTCGSCGATVADSESKFCDDCGGPVAVTVITDGIKMSKSVRNFYAVNKLEHVGEQITALGVKSTDDLLIIDDEDLSEAGLRRLDVKRFKAGVQNMRDASIATSDVEQKNDQDDTIIIDNDTLAAAAAEE